MDEALLEYADCKGLSLRIDRERGIVRGVKILGLESRNGRTYSADAVARARELYEGAKVNVNHPRGNPSAPRDYQDRIGVIRNVGFTAESGLFGDLHYNPEHALAGQLEWDAEHSPESVGLSHNVLARTTKHDEQIVVEAITRVLGVDLVADPATTRGLFEEIDATISDLGSLTLEQLRQSRPDLIEAISVDAQRRTPPESREQQRVERRTPEREGDSLTSFVRAVKR